MAKSVVHGLSIFQDTEDNLYRIRSTIRSGVVKPGQKLTFTASNGKNHSLEVHGLREGPGRHITLLVIGDAEAINDFKGGYYLFGS